jgi:hypothetical protein
MLGKKKLKFYFALHRTEIFGSPVIENAVTDAFNTVRRDAQLTAQLIFFVYQGKLERGSPDDSDWLSSSSGTRMLEDIIGSLGKGDRSTLALDSFVIALVCFMHIDSTFFPTHTQISH